MSLSLGRCTYVGSGTKVEYFGHVDESQSVVCIGNYCSIARNVTFFVDGNHHMDHASTYPFWEFRGIHTGVRNGWGKGAPRVGSDAWIGEGCMIMSGVRIGHGAVVCAGSVVTKDVQPYAIVAGNPALLKRYRFASSIAQGLLQSEWWDLPSEFVDAKLVPVQDDVTEWLQRALDFKSEATQG